MLLLKQRQQLAAHVIFLDDVIADVGTIEAGDKLARFAQRESRSDFAPGHFGRCRGQGDAGNVGPALMQHRQTEVLGTEVMTPL